jgi:hypothetical protein
MNARASGLWALLSALAIAGGGGANQAWAQKQAKPAPAGESKTLAHVRAERDELRSKFDAVRYECDKLRAWISLGETYERDLREGRLVAVVGDERTVFMERSALRRSLQRHVFVWTVEEFANSLDYRELRRLEDAEALKQLIAALEADALRQSDEYRRTIAANLEAQLLRLQRNWERQESLRRRIRQLEDRETELEMAEFSQEAVTPDPSRPWPAVDKYGLRLPEANISRWVRSSGSPRHFRNWKSPRS